MSTPDTIAAAHDIATPAYNYELAASRAAALMATASTVRHSYGSSWTSDGGDNDSDRDLRPTFETCSRAIVAAAERMVTLAQEPRSLAVAIAYDECLDIVTAAVNHLEHIESRGVLRETIVEASRAMHMIRELLRPSPSVRRALQF
ncbi:hypothetical protein PF005_g18896 [Phytophthora fragariae]|uniref:Uncharacterized protein n=1 Tax=Phytophthora fragariae TaxID=53985 RepID=A0A6A4CN14_9STRA|nr:hypothetical protein PF003_g11792 [Phytophthora fragariae]KAE8930069.1 hypothetical protein PF009_g19827 [Phytophthora fragariae]KAE8991761.1 hypothetical protein PF011_g17817 [Phytophthora fragariae]KAE9091324.1 hypothetical protein PF007_g18923 [Phytophthora fragariae]KAE9093033.1 hypothetical protein PF010_g17646 [Phytophthora fragariae]